MIVPGMLWHGLREKGIISSCLQRTVAVLPNGERAISIGAGTTGVYMRPVVGVVADQTVFVRDNRWRRYGMTEDGRTRLTGSGDARTP